MTITYQGISTSSKGGSLANVPKVFVMFQLLFSGPRLLLLLLLLVLVAVKEAAVVLLAVRHYFQSKAQNQRVYI